MMPTMAYLSQNYFAIYFYTLLLESNHSNAGHLDRKKRIGVATTTMDELSILYEYHDFMSQSTSQEFREAFKVVKARAARIKKDLGREWGRVGEVVRHVRGLEYDKGPQ